MDFISFVVRGTGLHKEGFHELQKGRDFTRTDFIRGWGFTRRDVIGLCFKQGGASQRGIS